MDDVKNATTNEQVPADQEKAKTEEVNLKAEMEKATEWAKKNPIPAGKSVFIWWDNIITEKACSVWVLLSLLSARIGRVKSTNGMRREISRNRPAKERLKYVTSIGAKDIVSNNFSF